MTSEVFPTVVRTTSNGFTTMPGRIFMIFYSYVMNVSADQLPWVSPLIMGILSLVSSFVSLALPDTRRIILLQTIEETEEYYCKEQTFLASFSDSDSFADQLAKGTRAIYREGSTTPLVENAPCH